MGKTPLSHLATLMDDEPTTPRPHLIVCVLGGFRLLLMGNPVSLSTKETSLLAALAVRGPSGASRDTLLSALWPDQDPRLASRSLHTMTWKLHRRLDHVLGSTRLIVHAHQKYALNACAAAVDSLLFERWADEGDQLAGLGDWQQATPAYSRAAVLYRGDLYEGIDISAELVIERERLRVRFQDLLTRLATAAYNRQDFGNCINFAQRFLATDPFHEGIHRLIMRCYARLGERSRALHQYQVCVALLRDELQIAPEAATTQLFEQIRRCDAGLIASRSELDGPLTAG
jgi:DNA-binding SARP family transcriptional activator